MQRCGEAPWSPPCEKSVFFLESESGRRRVLGRQEAEGHPALSQKEPRQRSLLLRRPRVIGSGPPAGVWKVPGIPPAPPASELSLLPRPARRPSTCTLCLEHLPGTQDPPLVLPGNGASLSPDGLSNSSKRAFSSSC